MPVKKCPLCLETKEVVSSHLMPAALYDYCREPGREPVAFNEKLVLESSRQLQHPLLCQSCEENLNKNGETWILPLFARYDGSFPFHEILTKMEPAVTDGEIRAFATARNPEIHAEMLSHFAMGIFWKSAVHSWSGARKEPQISLGPYAEAVRRYLRGESGFPAHMALLIGVLPVPVNHIAFTAPYQGRSTKWHNFVLYILGIEFTLLAGRGIDPETHAASFSGNIERPILLFNYEPDIRDIAVTVMKKAHKAKNVQKYFKKRQ
jgi:hypothetical protein